MADFSDLHKTQTEDPKTPKVDPGLKKGNGDHLQFKYTFPGAVFALNDTISGLSLPKGARIVDAMMHVKGSTGTTGIFSLGLGATTDADGNAIAEDLDSLVSSVDAGGQAALGRMDAGAAAHGVKLGSEAEVKIECTEATDAATGVELEGYVKYIVD
jgi:hypothetical protein